MSVEDGDWAFKTSRQLGPSIPGELAHGGQSGGPIRRLFLHFEAELGDVVRAGMQFQESK